MRTKRAMRVRAGMAVACAAGVMGLSDAALGDGRANPIPVQLESMRTLRVTTTGRVLMDHTQDLRGLLRGPQRGGDCLFSSTHTDASFSGGEYILQAGFVDNEIAATSYTINSNLFPIRIDLAEMIFATSGAEDQTITQWSFLVWEGTPTNGTLVAEFSSDDVILPHIRLGPGTRGVNVQIAVDPNDPEQIYVNDNGTSTFTIGFRVDAHNEPPSSPCLQGPPTCCNAFPVTDTSGLASATGNWLRGINCGPFGCPPNGGWARFSQLASFCRPSGDWVMRVTWEPLTCPGNLGACCFGGGGCLMMSQGDCATAHGSWGGPGSTCVDTNGNGTPDGCEIPGCAGDFNQDGALNVQDFTEFRASYLQGDMRCDYNSNSSLDVGDFVAFRSAYLAGCP